MTDIRSVLLVMPRWVRDGGVGAHLMESARALGGAGVEVTVLAARVESDERPAGVSIHHSPSLFKTDDMQERFARALAPAPGVVHLNQLDDPSVVNYLQGAAPVVLSAHGYLACTAGVHYFGSGRACTRAHGGGCLPNLLARGCWHRPDPRGIPAAYRQASAALAALRGADLAISYSHAMDAHLARNAVPRRRVVPYFPTLRAEALASGSGSGSGEVARRRVLFAGRVVTAKGIGTLIRACAGLDVELVVCGDGWQLPAMRRLAHRLGCAERVEFKGWLEPHELGREFARATVVAVPSLWPEPFGLVGIEAFALARPVVATDVGGIPEWLEHGVSGLCVAPGDVRALRDALRELLADPERQAAMGRAGQESTARRYSQERHVSEVLGAYRQARERWLAGAPAAVGAGS